MKEEGGCRVLAASGAAVDADATDVVPRVLRGDRLVPQDAVGQAGVLEVFPADVVKGLGTVRCAHAVHLYDDEAQIGQRGEAALTAERFRHERALWASIDLLDHGVFL